MAPRARLAFTTNGGAGMTIKIPHHVAIVMDGNGRWAQQRGLPRTAGHEAGEAALFDVVEGAIEYGVKEISAYAFSTENWNRPKIEVEALMKVLVNSLIKELPTLEKNNIKMNAIGNLEKIPVKAQKELQYVINKTIHESIDKINLFTNDPFATLQTTGSSRSERTPLTCCALSARSSPNTPAVFFAATLLITATSSIIAAISSNITKKPDAI